MTRNADTALIIAILWMILSETTDSEIIEWLSSVAGLMWVLISGTRAFIPDDNRPEN